MNHDKTQVMAALNCDVNGQSILYTANSTGNVSSVTYNSTAGSTTAFNTINTAFAQLNSNGTLWNYWQNCYYPTVIRESYPVYIQEKAMDKGKQAYEIIKALMDAGLLEVDKVKDFISAMDILLKTL